MVAYAPLYLSVDGAAEVEPLRLAQHILELHVFVPLLLFGVPHLLDRPVLAIDHVNKFFIIFIDGIQPDLALGAAE